MRAALYARYSSELQNERSIEDQFNVLRRHAQAKGWEVVATFSDAAISGAAMANRPGLQTLLAAAGGGAFDVVLVEDEDRLARNLEHQAHLFNRLQTLGVAIATLSNDAIGILEVGLKGLMGELYLVNLSQKTKRGMRANAEQGLATGSRTWGYRANAEKRLEIVEAEAEIVREVFTRYAAGESAREIAGDLNRRGVPTLRQGKWSGQAITGAASHGSGMLHQELYNGVKVTGKVRHVKDRDAGKTRLVYNPEAQWRRLEVPQLRIVPRQLWQAVQDRIAGDYHSNLARGKGALQQAARGSAGGRAAAARKHVFSGLIRCGVCGESYTAWDANRLVCAGRKRRGDAACLNGHKPRRAMIEGRVLEALQTRLLRPEAVERYARRYRETFAKAAAEASSRKLPLEKRIAELRRRQDRLVDAYSAGELPISSLAKAKEHEAERLGLEAELAAIDAEVPVIALHPAAPAQYARLVAELRDALDQADGEAFARPAIDKVRRLVLRIDVTPDASARDGYAIAIVGDLAMFLDGVRDKTWPPVQTRTPLAIEVAA